LRFEKKIYFSSNLKKVIAYRNAGVAVVKLEVERLSIPAAL
jgi:hypothetical protein